MGEVEDLRVELERQLAGRAIEQEALRNALPIIARAELVEAHLTAIQAAIRDEPLIVSGIRRDIERTPKGRGGVLRHTPETFGWGASGCPGDNLLDWVDRLRTLAEASR